MGNEKASADLQAAVAEQVASAALISPDPIWGIFSEISSETCLEAAEAADVPIMDL